MSSIREGLIAIFLQQYEVQTAKWILCTAVQITPCHPHVKRLLRNISRMQLRGTAPTCGHDNGLEY